MRKLNLASLVTMAVLSIFLQCRVEAENQIDMLNNQFLPAIIGEVEKKYSEKCKKAAEGVENPKIYQDLKQGAIELTTCIIRMTNVTAIQEKIQKARDLDTFFHQHCTDGFKCLRDFIEKVQPCSSATEREKNAVAMRIVTSLGDYVCSMGISHVARVFEEGPKCLTTTAYALEACLSNSFPDINISNFLESPDLPMDQSLCVGWEHFQSCTLKQLKSCREKTPANVAETVFKIIKNEWSCNQGVTGTAPINAVVE